MATVVRKGKYSKTSPSFLFFPLSLLCSADIWSRQPFRTASLINTNVSASVVKKIHDQLISEFTYVVPKTILVLSQVL